MLDHLISEWSRLTSEISKLHDGPVYLPSSFITGKMIPALLTVIISVSVFYTLSFQFVHLIVPEKTDDKKRRKVCYQLTNAAFNLIVGLVGLYMEYWILPTVDVFHATSTSEKIAGLEDECYWMAALQLGYQFWALPIGVIYINEPIEMVIHHVAVASTSAMAAFFNNGFRYYIPFFFGIMELSSVPLALMNAFRDNPEWAKRYPTTNFASRIIFAASFLYIRVYMCAWRWPVFVRDNFILSYTKEFGVLQIYFLYQWSLSAFLAVLQLYWAVLIVKGMIKIIFPSKEGKKKQKST